MLGNFQIHFHTKPTGEQMPGGIPSGSTTFHALKRSFKIEVSRGTSQLQNEAISGYGECSKSCDRGWHFQSWNDIQAPRPDKKLETYFPVGFPESLSDVDMETVSKWFQTELTVLHNKWGGGGVLKKMTSGNFTNFYYRYIKAIFFGIIHMIFSCINVLKVPRLVSDHFKNEIPN
jgi:hypothetical protein